MNEKLVLQTYDVGHTFVKLVAHKSPEMLPFETKESSHICFFIRLYTKMTNPQVVSLTFRALANLQLHSFYNHQTQMDDHTKPNNLYLISVSLFMFILPLISMLIELYANHSPLPLMTLLGKWFLFWGVGIRLFTAGVRQATNPAFTAKDIFHLTSQESFVIVKELGFANICLGLVAILSVFVPSSRLIAASAGGLFFGIAGLTHLLKKPVSPNEWIAMISDIFISVVMLAFILFCFWTIDLVK